jgi:hypothetical protein
VPLTLVDYERVRAQPTHFLAVNGHEGTEGSVRLVEQRGDHLILEKTGSAAEIARALDPRQPARPVVEDERAVRIGLNEALFREVNERIEELQVGFRQEAQSVEGDKLLVVCECGNVDCTERIDVPVAEYERVRSDGSHFLVTPGHEIASVERVIRVAGAYNVVEKDSGLAAALAEQTDPRD